MAVDPLARMVTIPFNGGSFTATRGLVNYLLGPDFVNTQETGQATVNVPNHPRTRVIGGPETQVAAFNYTRKKFPSALSNGGAGGEAIQVLLDGRAWTARLHGSHQDFLTFLKESTWETDKVFSIRSEKGKVYGPFRTAQETIIGA